MLRPFFVSILNVTLDEYGGATATDGASLPWRLHHAARPIECADERSSPDGRGFDSPQLHPRFNPKNASNCK
jgi:hypothetical protein